MSIKCDVIQDLLPSYIDGLTSEESNKLVKGHLSVCHSCSEIYDEIKHDIPNALENTDKPSDNSERKLVKRIKNKIITVVATLIITFSFLGFFVGTFGNVLFQEGNPIPVISSIIKLEFTNAEYVEFSNATNRFISEIKSSDDRYSVVKKYMSERGWAFKEQMGSGLIFENEAEQIVIETRLYTKNYFIWSVPEKETEETFFNAT
ncbi:putative zinc finger protein [Bacillus oleivorans]|uniref:Putative zinc finger protein n=1 Tax=Bacillus oleivorans TaxID=1448271 RepID=A0A285D4Z0_9BACI|nr:zf-HC2 domain-containing protein [Bacillus oleivorans]SNX74829.1 putative zinc finger protein [Bacillus oleivorans]